MVIEHANPGDLPEVHALLQQSHLPLDGLDEHMETMIVARDTSHVVGTAALELYADGALLRSVAVDPAVQGRRLGHRLTEAALQMAQEHGHGIPADNYRRDVLSKIRLRAGRTRRRARVGPGVRGIPFCLSSVCSRHAQAAVTR